MGKEQKQATACPMGCQLAAINISFSLLSRGGTLALVPTHPPSESSLYLSQAAHSISVFLSFKSSIFP